MRYKSLLVTGGAGFIGSNCAIYFKKRYPALNVYALDNLQRRGSELNIARLQENSITFIKGDVRNPKDLAVDFDMDLMIECSAEPSVMAGLDDPKYIIDVNLMGTVNCLELCRARKTDILFLSTSRVYPHAAINETNIRETDTRFAWHEKQEKLGLTKQGIGEDFTTTGPKTLYGATKLASELLIQEYCAYYGIHGLINRCGVIAGPWQFGKVDQGIFTHWMLAHYFKKSLNYIGFGGSGKQVRDLLHVDDLCDLIDSQVQRLSEFSGGIYNVGGGKSSSLSLLEATVLCQRITKNEIKIGSDPQTRSGDIKIYISDTTRVSQEFKWKPKRNVETTLFDVYQWIVDNETRLETL